MSPLTKEFYTTIASGGTVSDTVELKSARVAAIWSPAVDSCELYLRGSWDATSANFVELWGLDGTWRWRCEIGAGSMVVPLDHVISIPCLRVETSVAQTDVRTFVIGVKL